MSLGTKFTFACLSKNAVHMGVCLVRGQPETDLSGRTTIYGASNFFEPMDYLLDLVNAVFMVLCLLLG